MVLVRTTTVALVGNPNTGKTTLFNALAGMRQRVGNYPGVTVETKKGRMSHQGQVFDLIDLPGTYSLAARSPDEMVAVDLILGQQPGEPQPDVVIAIVDASNLERNFYLVTQTLELGVPVVVALNLMDVAEKQGIRINADQLSRRLGVAVIPIQANKGKGLDRLKKAVAEAAAQDEKQKSSWAEPIAQPGTVTAAPPPFAFPESFEREVAVLQNALHGEVPSFLLRRLLLDVAGYTEQRLTKRFGEQLCAQVAAARQRLADVGCPVPAVEARTRYRWIREALVGCVERPEHRPISWTDRLDRILTHRVYGTLIFLALMFVVFESIFTGARPLMRWISSGKDWFADVLRETLPTGPLSSLLVDGGLEGVGSVIVFLPQIVILFGFIAILEDCGYMARAAFLMDKLMSRCGLSGKSFIPLLSSVACAVPGIMATRVIEDRRDRLATILVAPLMSCSARLPVYILLIGAFLTDGFAWWVPGLVMFCMYAIGLITAPLVALLLKRTLLRGDTPAFIMEMPLYKWPAWRAVLRRMLDSGWAFLRRAGTLILAAMVLVWALLYFPRSDMLGVAYDERIAQLEESAKVAEGPEKDRLEETVKSLYGEWKRQSWLGRAGRTVEPAVRPLGWDWRIGMAVIASFPAREVVVGTLGIIYNQGKIDADEIREADRAGETKLGQALQDARWDPQDGAPAAAPKVFTVPVALSLMVFFALCCQCISTLAVIRRETNTWRWPVFTFAYMTVLAYLAALVVYQVGSLI
ncbi:MAG TPA: ferrous iron transport protein B [Gemmataceae bacterium]|nr:ferrous iron transport protein B [Gemmataceae bacterium]